MRVAWLLALLLVLPTGLARVAGPSPGEAVAWALRAASSHGVATRTLAADVRAGLALDALPPGAAPLDRAVLAAHVVAELQAGGPFSRAPLSGHDRASAAADALLRQLGHAPDPATARLDDAPPSLRAPLARVVDAFAVFEAAARAHGPRSTDLLGVLAARDALLDAATALGRALAETPPGDRAQDPIDVPGVLHVDLGVRDDVYQEDEVLLVDGGGNDTYRNNAGGHHGGAFVDGGAGANALLDFGGGNDAYVAGRDAGANGGAYGGGAGFLFDDGGADAFLAGGLGTNGGGYTLGVGFLLHGGGTARYVAGTDGVNGGGGINECCIGGTSGTLVDAGDGSAFEAGALGANGAGVAASLGALVAVGRGGNVYEAQAVGVNGAGDGGFGFLYDAGGRARFLTAPPDGAVPDGTNGGGEFGGTGFLWAAGAGNAFVGGSTAANRGGAFGGVGFLLAYGANRFDDAITHCESCSVVPKGLAGAQVDVR